MKLKSKLLKIWDMLLKEKSTRLTHIDDSVFFKKICVSKYKDHIEVYDTSTEVYRPLTGQEIDDLLRVGAKNFVRTLQTKTLLDQYHTERALFHRESIKGNVKKREYHFQKAKEIIDKLRNL